MVDRVAAALSSASDALLLVANNPEAAGWLPDVPVVPDVRPGCGGVGGVHAALARTGTSVLVVAWDMPFVPGALLRALRAAGEASGASAVVPESGAPCGFEPLCAWYAPTALAAVEQRLEAGLPGAAALHTVLDSVHLPLHVVRRYGDPAALFLNVNTPHDLAYAERQPRPRGPR